jgi:uncharacterized glyoxalase superfamily protein PhnB
MTRRIQKAGTKRKATRHLETGRGSPGRSFKNPRQLGQATQALYVRVDDINRRFARAPKADAKIVEPLADHDYSDRRYGAEDPQGHQWYFAQRIR